MASTPSLALAYSSDDEKWALIEARSTDADGSFVYGVRTTGVYCLPSCPSRQALRGNVVFFADAKEAVAAGLRPCGRCRPNQPSTVHDQANLIAKACRLLEDNYELTLVELARQVAFSPHHLHRMFKKVTGITPKAYATAIRSQRTEEDLRTLPTVKDAIRTGGHKADGFSERTANDLGLSPSDITRGGIGRTVVYATSSCHLGRTLVAWTDRGICAVLIGDDDSEVVHDLLKRFPKADVQSSITADAVQVAAVVAHIDNPGSQFALPLDIVGTAFQRRVWQVLSDIPLGETASYAVVAERAGAPSAARAVAQACGANHLAVLIPCHRVVRADGAISGYRWGVERKRLLLSREAHTKV